MNKSVLIINFFLGDRRKVPAIYNSNRFIFLEKQIEFLEKIRHNLDTIVFSFNLNCEDIDIIGKKINQIPKKIQNSKVEIILRNNNGMSYGAWAEYTLNNLEQYDYFFYNEDDYFFIEDDFDEYLINTFKKFDNCGYLCAISRVESGWNGFRKHAGYAAGVTSKDNIKKVYTDFKRISEFKGNDYKTGESLQIDFTHCFVENGMDIFDVRNEYRIPFATTVENETDIIYFFEYNNKDLLMPFVVENGNFTYSIADLPEFKKY